MTLEISAQFQKSLGLQDLVRFEHHVTETWKDLVIQPYLRREDVLDRNPYNIWTGKGSPTSEELVAAKVNKIPETHRPALLLEAVEARIEAILIEAEAREKKV